MPGIKPIKSAQRRPHQRGLAKPRIRDAAALNGLGSPLDRITDAAIRSFQQRGIKKTKIVDVARLAGLSRPNIYRYVRNMEDLIRLVILHRAARIRDELRVSSAISWHEALIDLFEQQVKTARNDEIFMLVVDQAGPVAADLLAEDNAVRTSLNQVIAPIIAKGRASGEIREGLTDEQILYWLHYQTWSLSRDPSLHNAQQIRDLARRFVVGGLIATASAGKRRTDCSYSAD